jgi:hypothetical protein
MAKDFDFDRLRKAVDWSVRQLKKPRDQRVAAVRQYVGAHYAEKGADRVVPVNMLELATTIYVRHLAARAPRAMVTTSVEHLKPFARNLELALEQIPEEIGLEATIRKAVSEALFGIGVVKVGIAAGGDTSLGHDVGEPFVDLVPLDDYFLDMSAKSRDSIQFEGNDYWLDLESAQAMCDEGVDLTPDDHTVMGEQGEERAEGVSVDAGADLYCDKVWLRDVWLPRSQEVVTYAVKSGKLVRRVPWDGPKGGPYITLSYTDVPGNLLPLPPVSLWMDLHNLANTLFRKLARQAEAKKTVAAFQGGDDDSVNNLKHAADGEGIRYNGSPPEGITVGGIDAPTLAFFLQVKDLFTYFGGNLDALGGLAPMTETASQDRMLTEAASARMASMKAMTIGFARSIFQALAWYEWTNPVRERRLKKPVPGTDLVLDVHWSMETRDGDYLDYNLDIDPYSMEDDTPGQRLQKIRQAFMELILPAMPLIQQQGGQIDFRRFMELVGKLGNIDELPELVRFGEPIMGDPQQGGSGMPSFKPAQTKRTYERVNRPGATRSGKDAVMGQLLMGGGVQPSAVASLSRGTT